MKKLEDLEKEFEEFKTDKPFVSNLIELLVYIEIGMEQLEEDQKVARKEYRSILIDKFMLNVMDTVTFTPPEEDSDLAFLNADLQAVEKSLELIDNQTNYLLEIAMRGTEQNVQELLKLVDFLCLQYGKNVDYIDYLRDVYEMQRKGFSMYNPTHEDTTEVLAEFMQKQLAKYEKVDLKPVEKKKKM